MQTTKLPRAKLRTMNLANGSHRDRSNGLCAMEVVAWLAGEPHSDHPACACPVLSAFMRSWNDAMPDADRTRLLRPLLPKLIGSASTQAVAERRAYLALDWLVREHTATWVDWPSVGVRYSHRCSGGVKFYVGQV